MSDVSKKAGKGDEVLTDPTKKVLTTVNPITKLWRLFMSTEKIGVSRWNTLLLQHIQKISRYRKLNPTDIGTIRGNFKKQLLEKDEMTIGGLLKGLELLGYDNLKLTITATKPTGEEISHFVAMSTGNHALFEATESSEEVPPPPEVKPGSGPLFSFNRPDQ